MLPRGTGAPPSKARPSEARRAPLIERTVAWSTRRRAVAIGGWLMLVAISIVGSGLLPGSDAQSRDPGGSGRAQTALRAQSHFEPPRENVLIQAFEPGGPAFKENPALRAAAEDLVSALTRKPGIFSALGSPLTDDRQVSRDGRAGLVTFFIAGPNTKMSEHFDETVAIVDTVAARHPDVRVVQAGDRSVNAAVDEAVQDDFGRAEAFSIPLTAVILILVFGSLVAAAIPLLLAASTVVAAFGAMAAVGKLLPINSAASSMILLIGVAVSVDYALFYLRREREERAAGHDVQAALRIAARTSGRWWSYPALP